MDKWLIAGVRRAASIFSGPVSGGDLFLFTLCPCHPRAATEQDPPLWSAFQRGRKFGFSCTVLEGLFVGSLAFAVRQPLNGEFKRWI